MLKLKQLLQTNNLVLELWWSAEDRLFYCLVSEGRESRGRTFGARSLPGLFNLIQKEFVNATEVSE